MYTRTEGAPYGSFTLNLAAEFKLRTTLSTTLRWNEVAPGPPVTFVLKTQSR
jgi:hypothetical protein